MPTSLGVGGYRVTGNFNEGIGDAGPGTPKAGTFAVADGAFAQVGKAFYFDNEEISQYYNAAGTIPALYGGWYLYVKMLAAASAAVAAGQLAFWSDPTTGVVTTDVTAATIGKVAGVILSASWVKGNYWWIYAGGGLCYVKSAAAVTDTTNGNAAVVTQTPAATVDGIADATAVTHLLEKSYLGAWFEAPANGALKRIFMNPRVLCV